MPDDTALIGRPVKMLDSQRNPKPFAGLIVGQNEDGTVSIRAWDAFGSDFIARDVAKRGTHQGQQEGRWWEEARW
jgi:hypothetical protein